MILSFFQVLWYNAQNEGNRNTARQGRNLGPSFSNKTLRILVLHVQMLHYFGFTIQLYLLRVFNIKVKNLAFDTSKVITNAWFSMKNYLGRTY